MVNDAVVENIVEFDAFDLEHRADPYPRYRVLRETAPSAGPPRRRPGHGRDHLCGLCRGAAGAEWGRGYADGLNPFRPGVAPGEVPGGSFLGMDPPDHTRLRALVSRALPGRASPRPRRPPGRRPPRRDGGGDGGGLDVVAGLARPCPSPDCRLLGVPAADAPSFLGWIQGIARGTDPHDLLSPADIVVRTACARDLGRYLIELVTVRRLAPRDDPITGWSRSSATRTC